ncbi:MAG: hypothetical protein PHE13_01875 [Bacteroidales bacterium]|nr:hypothetical protein [Bacteroidales bacterium]MDD4829231.1 hypothetical protein [Bacteroidales bacterium]
MIQILAILGAFFMIVFTIVIIWMLWKALKDDCRGFKNSLKKDDNNEDNTTINITLNIKDSKSDT